MLLSHFFTHQDGSPRTSRSRLLLLGLLALITLAGGWLRFHRLGSPSLWLDEILNVGIARAPGKVSLLEWIIGFERENGPLYFALHGLALKLPLAVESAFRLPSALLGLAAIPAVAWAAFRIERSALMAIFPALLLAVSPLHVFYSREGRPYALLVLASIGVLGGMIGKAGKTSPAIVALSLIAASFSALTAAPLVLAATVVALFDAALSRHRNAALLSLAASVTAFAYLLLYLRFPRPADSLGFDESFTTLGAIVLNAFTLTATEVSRLSVWSLIAAAFALAGYLSIRDRRAAHIAMGLMLLPLSVSLGALILGDHWFSTRYVIHSLAPFLVLTAAGIYGAARAAAGFTGRLYAPLASSSRQYFLVGTAGVLVTGQLALLALPFARTEPLARGDWRSIAALLAERAEDTDVVLTPGEWSAVSLRFYLSEVGRPLDVRPVRGDLELARSTINRRGRGWIVTGGWEDDAAIRSWVCTLCVLAKDRREDIRLAWAPDLASFLESRATRADVGRFVRTMQSRGGVIELDPKRDLLLGDGWHDAGGPDGEWFRWVRSEVRFVAPVPAGRAVLRIDAVANPGPKLPQTMTIVIGDTTIARHTISDAMSTYTADFGKRESSSIEEIAVRFDWEYSPAEIDGTSDTRKIAAGIGSISVVAEGSPNALPLPLLFHMNAPRNRALPGDEVCDGDIPWTTAGRNTMLDRLGYPRDFPLGSSRARLAAAIVDAVPPRECLSDRMFLSHVFRLLLERYPDRVGTTTYLSGMAHGWSRENVVCRISRAEEFMRIYGMEGQGE